MTVEAYLCGREAKFDLVYLDFCGSFQTCFETVETCAGNHLAASATMAYTVCNRGVTREQIAFNALRHRDMARAAGLALDTCVAYRDMVTVVMTRGIVKGVDCADCADCVAEEEAGHFRVERLTGWRVHQNTLQLRVVWGLGDITWEPASRLVHDLDRATFIRLVHDMP